MQLSRRIILIVLILALLVLSGILFQSFILQNFVRPVGLLLWAGLRLLRTFDQGVIWALLLFCAVIFLLLRLGRETASYDSTPPASSNTTLENVKYWRTSILVTHDEITELNVLKRYLGKMLAAVYAAKEPGSTNVEKYNALKQRSIPLPEPVYAFLFPAAPEAGRRSLWKVLAAIRDLPKKWSRRWSGRDIEEYYASIEEVLAYIESTVEIKNDDAESNNHNH